MNILFRLAIVWLLMGFALGLVARGLFRDRLKLIPFALTFLPWLIHLLYLIDLFALTISQTQLMLFVGVSVAIALLVFWVGFRSIGRRGRSLSLLPILLAVLYNLGPVNWLSEVVNQSLGLSYVPTLLFIAGTLMVFSLLFSYHLPEIKFKAKARAKKAPLPTDEAPKVKKKRRQL